MSLSTAESELTGLVEGLQVGRSVRALVELIMLRVDVELHNDNRAAIIIASFVAGLIALSPAFRVLDTPALRTGLRFVAVRRHCPGP